MNLNCNNSIIQDGLLVHIDLTNINSWDGNDDYNVRSLNKYKKSITSNIDLLDFGLTQFDIGATNEMWVSNHIFENENKLTLNRVGYNHIINPTNRETSGATITTRYDGYDISGITSSISGNYFHLNGGYLNNFFKLDGYGYELFPSRYRNGITFETILNINEDSNGIFLYLGVRAEDKYNPHYLGEFSGKEEPNGIHTSETNYYDSYVEKEELLMSFKNPEQMKETVHVETEQLLNIKNNLIGFYLTNDKRFGYKYINDNGNIVSNESEYTHNQTGFTYITIVFKPEYVIDEKENIKCHSRRNGDLMFYVNGSMVWIEKDFPEFYFRKIQNDREKQIGVPYNISWGGGSFGLKHSYHYDIQKYTLYESDNIDYISNNFNLYNSITGNTNTILVNSETMGYDGNLIDVMKIETTGNTRQSGIVYNKPIVVLSNREYDVEVDVYVDGFFRNNGKINLSVTSNKTEIFVFDETSYIYPKQYDKNWIKLKFKFAVEDNIGKTDVRIGITFESENDFNVGGIIYLNKFTYEGADILVKDNNKTNLTIENNFSNSFRGGIQKLRIYDKAFNQNEIQHNGLIEMNSRNDNQITISRGGRIIHK